MNARPTGVNLIGSLDNSLGLGHATRNTARLLESSPYAFSVTDFPDCDHRLGHPHGFEAFEQPMAGLQYGVNAIQFEPNILEGHLKSDWTFLHLEDQVNVLIPFWELSKFPEPWVPPLQALDCVFASTLHIADVVRRAAPDVPILHFPQAVDTPDTPPNRPRWGFGDDELVFLTSFDTRSDVDRKNPLGSIEAFQKAFPSEPMVKLVVRIRNADEDPRYADLVNQVRAAARSDSRLSVMDGEMEYHDVLELYSSADVLLSLHRAEGLGLVLMECMALGTPVIATAWSGNMDYTTEKNSALVSYRLVPARGKMDYYQEDYMGSGAEWAEPDIGEAASWMRRFRDDQSLLRAMSEQARVDMRARQDLSSRLNPFTGMLEAYEMGTLQSARHQEAARYLRSCRRERIWAMARDPKRAARAVGRMVESRLRPHADDDGRSDI